MGDNSCINNLSPSNNQKQPSWTEKSWRQKSGVTTLTTWKNCAVLKNVKKKQQCEMTPIFSLQVPI